MGTTFKHNAVLKLTHEEGMPERLQVDERYHFKLDGIRVFPLYPGEATLVHEINEKWRYAGLVRITQQTIDAENKFTSGVFEVSRIFDEEYSRLASINESPLGKSYY
jgi:hypothetical protein